MSDNLNTKKRAVKQFEEEFEEDNKFVLVNNGEVQVLRVGPLTSKSTSTSTSVDSLPEHGTFNDKRALGS